MTAAVRPPIDRVLTITRVFDAPRDLVRKAWGRGSAFDRLDDLLALAHGSAG